MGQWGVSMEGRFVAPPLPLPPPFVKSIPGSTAQKETSIPWFPYERAQKPRPTMFPDVCENRGEGR